MSSKVRIIGIIIMAVAVVFLVRRFLSFQVDFAELFTLETIPGIILVTATIMGAVFLLSVCWTIWLTFFSGKKVVFPATYSVFARSNLAKYLPGNIAQYAMRQLYSSSLGIKQREILISSILEILTMALTAIILSLILARDIFFSFLHDSFERPWLLPVIIAAIAAVVAGARLFLRKKKVPGGEILGYFKQNGFIKAILKVIGLTAIVITVYGTTLLVFFGLSADADIGTYGFLIVSAGIVSWLIGFITPGVPGGIGVREAVLLLMLAPVIPEEVVLYAAVAQRVAYIFADIFSWVAGKAVSLRPELGVK